MLSSIINTMLMGVLDNLPISFDDNVDKSKILAVLLVDSNHSNDKQQLESQNINLSQYVNLLINCIISNQYSFKIPKLNEFNVIKILQHQHIFISNKNTHH